MQVNASACLGERVFVCKVARLPPRGGHGVGLQEKRERAGRETEGVERLPSHG